MTLFNAAFDGGRFLRKCCNDGGMNLRQFEGKRDGREWAVGRGPMRVAEGEVTSGANTGDPALQLTFQGLRTTANHRSSATEIPRDQSLPLPWWTSRVAYP
jgi:hypothetical protein